MPEPTGRGRRFVILVTEPHDHPYLDILRSIGEVRLGDPRNRYSEDSLAEALRDCDAVLITSRDTISRRVIEAASRLKVIGKSGARPEKVDVEAAAERGIKVIATPTANPESVSEHAILLMLAVQRRLFEVSAGLRAGGWRDRVKLGTELAGKTVGIVGLGNVGAKVAKKLSGFDVRLIAYDPYADASKAASLGVEMVGLDTLLKESDVITLHAMVTPQSRHMIGEVELRKMKPTAVLINTARGPLIDEPALVRALREKWIGGAGLDVFEEEPVPATNPLFALDSVIVTPHVAAYTQESMDRELTWTAEDIKRVLLGEEPLHS